MGPASPRARLPSRSRIRAHAPNATASRLAHAFNGAGLVVITRLVHRGRGGGGRLLGAEGVEDAVQCGGAAHARCGPPAQGLVAAAAYVARISTR